MTLGPSVDSHTFYTFESIDTHLKPLRAVYFSVPFQRPAYHNVPVFYLRQ